MPKRIRRLEVPAETTILTMEEILSAMQPGKHYTAKQISMRWDWRAGVILSLLTRAVACDKLVCVTRAGRTVYCLRSIEVPCAPDRAHPKSELKGYDAQWKQFRALCETVRPQGSTRTAHRPVANAKPKTVTPQPKRA